MVSGWLLPVRLILLCTWVVLLLILAKGALTELSSPRTAGFRRYSSLAGFAFSLLAVTALLALHTTWTSPGVSQKLGVTAVSVISQLIFWPAVVGVILAGIGTGRRRWFAFASSFLVLCWWYALVMGAAISMGAVLARHPTRYLIPLDYVGWVKIQHTKVAPPLAMSGGIYICQVPRGGVVSTSSPIEEGWAKDEYFYYADGQPVQRLSETGWGAGGLIWGNLVQAQQGSTERTEFFFVGTEEQFRKAPPPPH